MHERLLCMEAVVSDILPNGMINPALFIFVCTYIDQLTNAAPVFITQSEVGVAFTIFPMKQHRTLLSLEVIEVARLKQKVVEDQETLQAMSQRLELVQKEKSQLEQQLKEMQKVWQMKMLELFYVNLFCLACFHTGKRRKPQGIIFAISHILLI